MWSRSRSMAKVSNPKRTFRGPLVDPVHVCNIACCAVALTEIVIRRGDIFDEL